MSNLKDLTWEHHQNAERQEFVKVMMSGKINPQFYATYLWNQHLKYDLLEALISVTGKVIHIQDIFRKPKIYADFTELWADKQNAPKTCQSTLDYIAHLKGIMSDPEALMAHVYVLHMGDLSGGQIIKKRVPGQGLMYEFEGDVENTKNQIRELINDDMADEAKLCFEFSTKLFQDLMEIEIEHYME